MKKIEVIQKASDFDLIIQKGKKQKNKYFNVFCIPYKTDIPLFGIAISKKNGNAVVRNKNKRQLRHIIDKNKKHFKNEYKYIIMIKGEGVKLTFDEKESELIKLIKEEK